jgi:hypothetical protein
MLSFRNSTRFIAAAVLAVAIGMLVHAHNTSNASAANALAAGAALPQIWHGPTSAYLSSILFGGSVLAVIAAVTSFVRKRAEPHAWIAAIAAVTIAFGTGQCIGPLLSGALSDGPNGVHAGPWLSVRILAVASVVAAFQPEPAIHHRHPAEARNAAGK